MVMETRHGASRQQTLSFLELFPWPVTQSESRVTQCGWEAWQEEGYS